MTVWSRGRGVAGSKSCRRMSMSLSMSLGMSIKACNGRIGSFGRRAHAGTVVECVM